MATQQWARIKADGRYYWAMVFWDGRIKFFAYGDYAMQNEDVLIEVEATEPMLIAIQKRIKAGRKTPLHSIYPYGKYLLD